VRSEVLQGVKEDRNILPTIKRKKAKCVGHILRRNCLLNRIIERKKKLEMMGRREEEIGFYRMNLMRREDTGNLNMKH
jgi:hypothetical protein